MILFKKGKDLRKWLESQRSADIQIGFVPTMGALHEGHLSLIRSSKKENRVTVCSIFVNPTQFNNVTDLEKYPVTIEKDIDLLEQADCDILFLPSVNEMYPEGLPAAKIKTYELGELEHRLEGEFRPGHYQGVAMIVHRLMDIVHPGKLYLGQKDYQQCLVILKLLEIIGSNTEILMAPTLREKNGLAMSSRNARLSAEEKDQASAIHRTLTWTKNSFQEGKDISHLVREAKKTLEDAGLRPEYLEIANAKDLSPVNKQDEKEDYVILTAAWMNEVRLIDNIFVKAIE
jgi:pantoate--beta-alanine ligase